ncbi:MAG: hypothetical protein D3923_13755 [Candidatus Electrothrix sp. AR3]|nr:hypothetical protein [Candidatus Electrothrix sp. AR3]
MKTIKFLLVCEGPTDIAFLKELSSKIGEDFNAAIELIELSPERDATTNQYPSHGWPGVRSWCRKWKRKTPEELEKVPSHFIELMRRRYWKALIDINGANGLIIQMDTDIAEQLCDLDCHFTDYEGTRRSYCQKAILSWLGESAETLNRAYLLLPSFAIETWLLATHDPDETVFDDLDKPFNYEELLDVENRLIAIGYAAKEVSGKKRLKKQSKRYKNYGKIVFPKFHNVKQRCTEADYFYQILTNHFS